MNRKGAFNQQVKNNIQKFDDDFRFQLTKEEWENLRSKFLTSSWGGTRYLPYAFTEQGIYMLMTVLKGDLAARQSKSIIRLFKKEKPFVCTLKRRRSFSAEASSACPCSLSTRWRSIGSTTRMAMKSTLTTATFSKRNTMLLRVSTLRYSPALTRNI
ncbi:MAG: ORF6N domain-containing protein [Selenomonas sp.]|nr:ORF6N domain-containing protein [Selenomonas sp.]